MLLDRPPNLTQPTWTPSTSWNPESPLIDRYVEIRIHGRKAETESGRTDLNFVELRRPGILQPFYIAGPTVWN